MTREELLKAAKPILFNTDMVRAILDGRKTVTRRAMKPQPLFYTGRKYIFADDECPKKWECCNNIVDTYQYHTGDILYVRETWSELSFGYVYKVDREDIDHLGNIIKWRPSIHMPKKAARIFLRVTDVRMERLQDIKFEDCLAEGAFVYLSDGYFDRDVVEPEAKKKFGILWDSTIPKSDLARYGWDANPWVWVIEFERVMDDE